MLRSSPSRILAAGTVLFAAALSALPAPTQASPLLRPCLDRAPGYDPFKAADVVAEGVLLSGPSFHGALFSPARFHVVRYLKGRGPREIRVRTSQRQVATGEMSEGLVPEFARIPGDAEAPNAGEVYRIFARTRGRNRNRRGLSVVINTCTGDDRRISIRRLLRPLPRTLVRRRSGGDFLSVRLYRGRGKLRCLRLARFSPSAHFSRTAHGACGYPRRPRSTLVALDAGASTAIALAAKGLRGFTATRLADGVSVTAGARRGVAIALLPGGLEQREVGILARYRDGSTRTFGGLDRRARVADPLGGPPWVAEHERAYPNTARRRACVVVWIDPDPGRSGECGSTGTAPFFFAIRHNSQPSAEGGIVLAPGATPRRQTAVFGAISQAVSDVTVKGPDSPRRPAISRRGRSFIAVFAGHVPVSQLTLSFVLSDGRTLSYSGRRALNLAPPPR